MIPGTALTHVDLCGLAALRVQGLAHRRALWTWPPCFVALKVSAAARIQAVLCQDSTGPRNCSQAVAFTHIILLTGTTQKLNVTAIVYICTVYQRVQPTQVFWASIRRENLHHWKWCSAAPDRKQCCKGVLARQEIKGALWKGGNSEVTTEKAGSGWFRCQSV